MGLLSIPYAEETSNFGVNMISLLSLFILSSCLAAETSRKTGFLCVDFLRFMSGLKVKGFGSSFSKIETCC